MLPAEREQVVLSLIEKKKFVSVSELSQACSVSEMTIRRDLARLEERGLLVRTYGGGIGPSGVGAESPFLERSVQNAESKRAIAEVAAGLVEPNECIGIDVGTTTLEFSRRLTAKGLTVVTSSLAVLNELLGRSGFEVICTGGILRERDRSFVGTIAERTLGDLCMDKSFIGVAGIDRDQGFTAYNMHDAAVKRVMIEHSREVIILADSSKFGKRAFARVAPIRAADVVACDGNTPAEWTDWLRKNGVRVVIAPFSQEERHAQSG
ncbi:MAG: DeoR/GlpR transcriptional regulator [Firmicutes bacterium]|nr:DeoR/GlpR transcriptional regulator [Bacillota bacterium]